MNRRFPVLLGGLALAGFLCCATNIRADYVYPSPAPAGQTVVGNLTDLGTILGAEGTAGLPTNASTTQNELVGTFNQSQVEVGGSPPNTVGSHSLLGMYGNLTPFAEYNSTTKTTTLIGPGPITFNQGDILYFGNAGRNNLTGGPAGSGGYFLVSDNMTGAKLNLTGNGANESPQNLALQPTGSSFSVSNTGAVTGTPDNFNNGTGNVVDTAHIVLAGTFEAFSSISGLAPPSTFGSLPAGGAPLGTVYAEIGTNGVGGAGTTAQGSVGFGFLNVVGGSSASSFNNNSTFTAGNTIGVAAHGGPAAMEVTINSTFNPNIGTVAPYTQFQSGSNDPDEYLTVGAPEPASIVMLTIGLVCSGGGAYLRRRFNRKAELV